MQPIDRMHLGARIKHLREYRKISTRDMAKRLEMDHVQYLNDVEGTEQLSEWVLDRVSRELDFPADYIRDWMDNAIYFTQNITDQGTGHAYNGTYINNPLDKIIELYETLLRIEREKNGGF